MTNKPKCSIKGCKEQATCYIWDNTKKKNMFVCENHKDEIKDKNNGKVVRKGKWLLTYESRRRKLKTSQKASNHQFRAPYWEAQAKQREDEYLNKEEIKFGAREV